MEDLTNDKAKLIEQDTLIKESLKSNLDAN